MIDTHLHIGQFMEARYDPAEILDIVLEAGVNRGMYSSTTSAEDGVHYRQVEREIAATAMRYPPEQFVPLLWYIPPYIDEELSPKNAFAHIPYGGIKLHPRSHRWRLTDKKHLDCLHTLFGFAHERGLPVLIHTGVDSFEKPGFFAQFFGPYPNAKIILAHCRPATDTLDLFRRYPHVHGDTAFLPETDYELIKEAGFIDRLLPGTDFPITHYYRLEPSLTLKEQYALDLASPALLAA